MMGTWGSRGMMGYGGMGAWMMRWGDLGQGVCSAMAGHIEGRLAYIKAELKITEAQEPLLDFLRRRCPRQRKLYARALQLDDDPAWCIFGQPARSA